MLQVPSGFQMFTDKSTFIEWIGTMADRANANSPFGDRETEHFISTLRLTFTNFRQAAGSFKISKFPVCFSSFDFLSYT